MIEIDRATLAEAIAELVRIPSINPTLVPGSDGEAEIARHIAQRLRRTPSIEVELQDTGGGRPNVIATVGRGLGRTLMINGHIDTVGVAGMDEPFSGRVEGHRLYGRGAVDMKGAVGGVICLLEAVAYAGDFPGRLIATFVVDEEHSSIGTEAVCREVGRRKPNAAIVVEPSGLTVTIAHKGFAWAEIETRGLAAHGSDWKTGVDAIVNMGRVLTELERYSASLLARSPHELVGPPSVHASLIEGGQELSSYPERCLLQIERRTIPGESREQVTQELDALVGRATDGTRIDATLRMGLYRKPFGIGRDAEIVQTLARELWDELGTPPVYRGAAGWMDSALLAAAGVPTVIFGPDGGGAHAAVEWADLPSVERFIRVLARTAYAYCRED